jgi:hypothetical protein
MNKQRERLVELINEAEYESLNYEMANKFYPFDDYKSRSEFVADYLLVNGVIVPPCKVGQTVYLLQKYYGTYCFNVVEDKVQMIGVTSRGIHIKARNHQDHNKMYMLGKTVFLTKEEAEQALNNISRKAVRSDE